MIVDEAVEPRPVVERACARGGGELLAAVRVFDLYRGEQVGRGQQVARAAARVPLAGPHAHRRGGRRALRARDRGRRSSRSEGASRALTARRACVGAVRVRAARSPPRSSAASVARAGRRSPRGRERGGGSTTSIRATACRSSSRASTPDAVAERARRRVRRLPARRRRAGRRGAARARPEGRGPVRRLPPRPRALRALVPAARGAGAARARPCRPAPSCTATRSAARPGRRPRLLPDRRAARALRRSREHDRATRSSTPRPACPAPAATPPTTTHFVSVDENVNAYKVEGHRHARRARAGAGGSALARSRSRRTCVPLDQGLLASCYVTPTRDADDAEVRGAVPRRLRGRAVHRARGRAAGRARRARHQPLPHPRDGRAGDGRVLVFAAIDNLWKGAAGQAVQDLNLMLGLDETEGLRVSQASSAATFFRSRWVERAGARDASSSPHALPAGFRAAGVAAGIKPRGRSTSGVLVSRRAGRASRPRASRRNAAWARR